VRTPEGKLKDKLKAYLEERGVASLSKPNPKALGYYHMFVPMGYGSPLLDFTVCYRGRFLLIETKSSGNKPTPRQILIQKGVAQAQGYVIIDNDWEALKLKVACFFDSIDQRFAIP
jgi:hypothetical protein